MTPFQLDVELRTPLAGGDVPTLDAVLLGEMARLNPDAPDYAASPEAAREALSPLLKITDGIPHASILLSPARMAGGIFSRVQRHKREFDEIGARNLGIPEGRRTYPVSKKEGIPILNNLRYHMVNSGFFFGVGDIDEIRHVLRFWQGIGAQWRNGWGCLAGHDRLPYKKWRIQAKKSESPQAWGLVGKDNRPIRPMPFELFASLSGNRSLETTHARARPPYWSTKTKAEQVVLPGAKNIASAKGRTPDKQQMVDFLFERFARFVLPPERMGRDKAESVQKALSGAYHNKDKNKEPRRLGFGAILLATPSRTILAANVDPEQLGKPDDSFQLAPVAASNQLLADALTEGSQKFIVVEFRKESAVMEHMRFSFGDSDSMKLNCQPGLVRRKMVLRIAELEKLCKLPPAVRRHIKSGKNPLFADQMDMDDMQIELAQLRFYLNPTEERVLKALAVTRAVAAKQDAP